SCHAACMATCWTGLTSAAVTNAGNEDSGWSNERYSVPMRRVYLRANTGSIPDDTSAIMLVVPVGATVVKAMFLRGVTHAPFSRANRHPSGSPFSLASSSELSIATLVIKLDRDTASCTAR